MNDNRSCNVRQKLHGNISRNIYGNAVIGRYGGCFEEDVWAYGFWMYWRSMHNSHCEQKAMHNTEEASKYRWWKCQKPQLNISQNELTSLLQTTSRFSIKSMIKIYSKEDRSQRHKYPARPSAQLSYYESLLDMESYQVLLHLQQFQSLQYGTSLRTTIHYSFNLLNQQALPSTT